MITGIDISKWQGDINFNLVKQSGIDFIIPRSAYGHIVDERFFENVRECKLVHLPVVGAYHFSYALSVAQAAEEAKFTIEQMNKAQLSKKTIIFFDLEYKSIEYAAKNNVQLSPKEVNLFATAFCDEVISAGFQAGLYLNNDFYKNWYSQSLIDKYITWLADWNGNPDHPCDFHQYGLGKVSGITNQVDVNHFLGAYSLGEVAPKFSFTPTAPSASIDDIAKEVIRGKWGVGNDRKIRLKNAGYDPVAVQKRVNELLS